MNQYFKRMKILIIGSKGFIGSHAVKHFSNLPNFDCWSCDVVVDYNDNKYFVLDSTNSDFNEIFEQVKFDVCINCSGAASVPDSLLHPLRDFMLNTHNVAKMLEAIRKHVPHCKFINLSSAAVYGNPVQLPIMEEQDSRPVSPYGNHKWYAEEICREYGNYFNVKSCSLRIFSAYGPGLKKQLLWDIAQKSKAGNLKLYGTGNETRDFIYVEDIVSCLEIIIHKGEFLPSSVYNIANGEPVRIKDIAETLLFALNFQGDLSFSGEERLGDPIHWQADITKIKALGYRSSFSIQNGVIRFVKWLQEEKLL